MRLALFSPVSPQKTGISDYTEQELLPYLSKYFDIDVYTDRGVKPTNRYLTDNFTCFSFDQYEKNARTYDMPIYHMGNNYYHRFIYDSLLKHPGITVFHDILLHGFLWGESIAKGDTARYIAEFEYCYGSEGVKIAQSALQTYSYPEFTHPLIKRIVDSSVGVICHSEFGITRVLEENPDSICTMIPQPFSIRDNLDPLGPADKNKILAKWGIGNKSPVISSFGYIYPHKRYDVIFEAFKEFIGTHPDAVFVIVGEDNVGLSGVIREMGLENHVIITGYVPEESLLEILQVSDFCVNLRYPTAGETSRSVLQIMSLGVPVIVSNIGWFVELPNDTCLKVDVDSFETTVLLDFFTLLADDSKIRAAIGKSAKAFIRKNHSPDNVAKHYYQFITGILNGNALVENTLSRSYFDLGLTRYENEAMGYQLLQVRDLFS